MPIKINFDITNNAEYPTFVLATRNGNKLGNIEGIESPHMQEYLNAPTEFEFTLHKEIDGEICKLWDKVKDFRLIWCKEWDKWFTITVEIDESDETIKKVSAIALAESELAQIKIWGIEINTENDILRDDYEIPTTFYNQQNPKASLLDRILEKAPHYKISHVDYTLTDLQRTFTFDGVSIYDAFKEIGEEINCLFIFDSSTSDDGEIARGISVYDLQNTCIECNYRGDFLKTCPKCGSNNIHQAYGEDTTIFISKENLTNEITLTVNTDAVKNCFRLTAGDDLMTSTIRNCNPNGSGYIWYISDDMKEDMSETLVQKLNEYDVLYNYYQKEHIVSLDVSMLENYNSLVKKYSIYNDEISEMSSNIIGFPELMNAFYNAIDFELFLRSSLMPNASMSDTTASQEIKKLIASNLSPVSVPDVSIISLSTADSAILAMAKTLIHSKYQIKISNSSLSSQTWTGNFIITNYSDEEDTATSNTISVTINDDYEAYVNQMIKKTLSKSNTDNINISDLFSSPLETFKSELKKYCLDSLKLFYDACQACTNVLIEQGASDVKMWQNTATNLYDDLYYPYYQKQEALVNEIAIRESELATISGTYNSDGDILTYGIQNYLDDERTKIQKKLDFENYLGESLWLEFCAYRREDEYKNDNYISDGLTNDELFRLSLEFVELAKKEIYNSSEKQYSISSSLRNLLAIEEFKPLTKYFKVGNWIRIEVDGIIYKLRLLSYSIHYDTIQDIEVEFSEISKDISSNFGTESIMKQAVSMATSYPSVKRQASKGEDTSFYVKDWVDKGLDMTNVKLMNNVDNQDQTWDSHGMLFRKYDPITETYSETQLKIINSTIAVTDDAWKTSKTAIGRFLLLDPRDGEMKESYGVIAQTLVGNLILSEDVGIYNENNNITLNKDGLVLTTNGDDDVISPIFTIQRKYTDSSGIVNVEKQLYIDEDGNMILHPKKLVIEGANIKDEIDSKSRTFVEQPIPPYNIGDLWVQGENGELLKCQTAKKEGEEFEKSDWVPATKYTDDTLANAALEESKKSRSLNVLLSNDFQGVTTEHDGSYDIFPEVKTTVSVYYGTANVTNLCEYEITKSAGLVGRWEYETKTYTVTELNTDDGWVDITASYSDLFSTTKRFIVSKIKGGTPGIAGTPGKDGVQLYTWVKYADTPTSGMSDSPVGKTYIGLAYNKTDIIQSTNYEDYSWSLIKGKDGVPGEKGEDGQSLFTWIKYATSASGANISDDPTGKTFIGLAYNKLTAIESDNPQDYSWALIKGEKGEQGIPGKDGKDGITTYYYIRFSENPNGNPMTISPTDQTKYIGVCASTSSTAPVSYSAYLWTKCRGEDGKNGTPGVDGKSSYFHVKYSNDGETFTTNSGETIGDWIGICIDESSQDPMEFANYTWHKIKGEIGLQGEQGIPGKDGKDGIDGKSTFFHVKYSNVQDPISSDQMTEIPSKYIGTYVDYTEIDSSDPSKYTWSQFMGENGIDGKDGEDGIPGKNGEDGKTYYLHIKYSNDGGKTFTDNNGETTGEYIGVYTDITETDSFDPSKYTWSLIKGKDGIDGINGKDGQSTYFYVRFSENPNGNPMTTFPDLNTKYMGVCSTNSPTAPTLYTSYTWTQCKGNDGTNGEPGVPGEDGKTQYLHIKYSNDGETFTSNNGETLGTWIGTFVDFNEKDSMNFSDYTWKKFVGSSGRNYMIEVSDTVIKKGADNVLLPSNITIKSFYRDGDSAKKTPYSGRFKIEESVDGIDFATKYESTSNENTKTYIPSNSSVKIIRCSLYASGDMTTTLDIQTIVILTDISSLEIGGRNLATDTNTGSDNWFWIMGEGDYTKCTVVEGGIKCCKLLRGTILQKNYSVIGYKKIGRELIEPNTTYTISFDVKANINTSFLSADLKRDDGTDTLLYSTTTIKNNISANTWCQCIFQVKTLSTLPTSVDQILYLTGMNSEINTSYIIKNLKIEKGNIPTAWTPAPEDIEALNVSLSNDNVSISTAENGTEGSFDDCVTAIQVFYGLTDVTMQSTYSITKSSGITGNWDSVNHVYKVTALSTDNGYVDFEVTYNDISIIKRFTVSKAKKGDPGEQGTPGKDGLNGKTSYFHIKYSNVSNPTTASQMTEVPAKYIGTYVDYAEVDSSDPSKYTWSQFIGSQGEQGIPGKNGENGKTSYLHIKYSDDGGKTFTDNNGETPGKYIGQYVDFTEADSIDIDDYTWMLIKGENGVDGVNGRTYILQSDTLVIKQGANKLYTPKTVKFQAFYRDGNNEARLNYNGRFKIEESMDGEIFVTKYTSSTDEQSYIYTPTSNNLKMIRCTLYATGGINTALDLQSISIVKDIDNLTQDEVFNILTNGGENQGIYLEDEKIYINGEHIKAGSIVGESIAAGTITALQIKAGAITSKELDSECITSEKIKAGAITSDALASNSIKAKHIDAKAVTADKISVTDLSALKATIGGMTIANDKVYGEVTSGETTWGSGIAPYKQNQYSLWVGETNQAKGTATTDAPFKVSQNGTAWIDKLYAGNSLDLYESNATWKGNLFNIFREDGTLKIKQNHHDYGKTILMLDQAGGEAQLVFNYAGAPHGTVYFYSGYNSTTYVGLYHKERNDGAGGAIFRYQTDSYLHILAKTIAAAIECTTLTQTSTIDAKENYEEFTGALNILSNAKIYKYDLKQQYDEEGNEVETAKKKQYGLIIEKECPEEFVGDDEKSINLYSMTSIMMQAIKELEEKVRFLENERNNKQ